MANHLNILIGEDSEEDALLMLRHLHKAGYEVNSQQVKSADDMVAAIKDKAWEIILCDYKLPGFSAEQALEIRTEHNPELPLIIVTGTLGEERAVDLTKLGAADLVLKDNLSRLIPAIERAIKEARSRREMRQIEDSLVQSEERFRSLFEGSHQGILIHRNFKPLEANQALATIFGYDSPFEILSKNARDLFAPGDRELVTAYHKARIKGLPSPRPVTSASSTTRFSRSLRRTSPRILLRQV